jgi:hypothetical protein
MTDIQVVRSLLAEFGVELTLDETKPYLDDLREFWDILTYEQYVDYKEMTDADIKQLAKDADMDYDDAKDICDLVIMFGDKKFT